MGYYMEQIGSEFSIKKENKDKAWDSLKKLFVDDAIHYAWIDSKDVLNSSSFIEAMSEARWDLSENANGDVCSICFNGEKYGDEFNVLESIAPYVEDNSYIIMQGEQGERWKWKFTNGHVEEINGHWVWDDEMETDYIKKYLDRDFYHVEFDNESNKKVIHNNGYCYISEDHGKGEYRELEYSWFYVDPDELRRDEGVYDYLQSELKQFIRDRTEKEIIEVLKSLSENGTVKELDMYSVTDDTPEGWYVDIKRY